MSDSNDLQRAAEALDPHVAQWGVLLRPYGGKMLDGEGNTWVSEDDYRKMLSDRVESLRGTVNTEWDKGHDTALDKVKEILQ